MFPLRNGIYRINILLSVFVFCLTVSTTENALSQSDKDSIYIPKVMLGRININELILYADESVLLNAISEEIQGKISINNYLIQKEIDGYYYLLCEGFLDKKNLALRFSLSLEDSTDLYLTSNSLMEYCISDKKCGKMIFLEKTCLCESNPKNKKIKYIRKDGFSESDKGFYKLFVRKSKNGK